MHYIYVLKSKKTNKLYIGFTNNLKRRIQEHNRGEGKFTRAFLPWKLIYYESYSSKKDAAMRERQLKRHAKAWGQLKKRIDNCIYES